MFIVVISKTDVGCCVGTNHISMLFARLARSISDSWCERIARVISHHSRVATQSIIQAALLLQNICL